MKKLMTPTIYQKLIKDISAIYEDARTAMVRAWWRIGRRIVEEEQAGKDKAPFGSGLLEKLSRDLTRAHGRGFSYTSLKHMRRFYLMNPNRPPAGDLSLTHHIELMPVQDQERRRFLEKRSLEQGLTRNEVRELVRAETGGRKKTFVVPASPPKLLTPVRGRLHTHQIVEKNGALYVDLGFRNYRKLTPVQSARFKKGDFVERLENESLRKLPDASAKDLYTYEAQLDRIYDADTQWYFIFTGRGEACDMKNDKLRLRGIDCRELSSIKGKAAKKFVEKLFARATGITITTTKPDKFDRYLSDIFIRFKDGSEVFLNNELLKNGFARHYSDPKPEDWDD